MKRRFAVGAGLALGLGFTGAASAATLKVGPGQTYAKPCDAIAAASAGDTIQVDAAGSYDGDTCAWMTDNLTIVGVNGRPKIDLTGVTPAQQKGIFTIYAPNATIDNLELSGAAISAGAGNNGAGIRHQGLNLTVKNCYLHDNQDGILGAPATANTGSVTIENTELYNNGAGDGYSHNAYLGDYQTVTFRYSWTHHSLVGHLFKSRAYTTYVLYNRLSDDPTGTGSYELDLPNAGTGYVIGNVIEQGPATMNDNMVGFGEEGVPSGYDTHLYFVNNTLLNDYGKGTFVNNATSTGAVLTNNIFFGGGAESSHAGDTLTSNYSGASPMFKSESAMDVHLLSGSPCIDQGTDPGKAGSVSLDPVKEYVAPTGDVARAVVGKAIDIGAYEYGNPDGGAPPGDAGDGGSSGGTDSGVADAGGKDSGGKTPHDSGAADSGQADGSPSANSGSSGGCSCRATGPAAPMPAGAGLLLALGWLLAGRRRTLRNPKDA